MQNVQGFLLINLYAFLLIVSTCIIFFLKKHLKQIEGTTYSKFLIANLFVSITGLILGLLVSNVIYSNELLIKIANKCYLISLFFWVYYFTFYTVYVALKNKSKINSFIPIFKFIKYISVILIAVLPVTVTMSNTHSEATGYAILYTYLVCGIGILIQIICLIANINNLNNKKFIPIYVLIFLGGIIFTLQVIEPSLNYLINPTLIFISFIMYHTIENPDIKLLNEVYKNKELMEQTYEDKSNFLFELTQEVRDPLYNLSTLCNKLKEENDVNKIKENINVISNSVKQLDFIVNDVLNVSSLDVQKVKFVEGRYNLKHLFEDLVSRVKVNENVEFRTHIPNNVPYLYGDYIKLKQVLYSLLMNAVNKTESGFIEFKVDIIEKYDVARIIFSIYDSGIGMSIDKVNEILSTTGEFDSKDLEMLEKSEINIELCQKIVKALGGNLLIKSKVGKGTEVMLTVDQRIFIKEDNENIINSYETNEKKVLVVCQDKEITEVIKKELNNNKITGSYILYGMNAIDKIRSGKKYDYIIVEDDMKEMTGYETLKKLKEQKKFNIPVIILIDKDKENIKNHFIEDGFKDYILISDLKNEIIRIINKY